ncbi:ATP-dependent nuclease [Niameybacter massiliensis]|uniref:ATP-dependent nuclease n=1 Tax=Niameybacter massiliensis TaxID=1658108 RepID=UPI0006B637DF|nr:AAA family ATPase [Niameybacter massiliensis]
MNIRYLKVKGFRGIDVFEAVMVNNMLTIVGKNDIGKSSVLRAIRIFFGDENFGVDDFSKNDSQGLVEIELYFEEEGFEHLKDEGVIKVKQIYQLDEKAKIKSNVYIWKELALPTEDELENYTGLKKIGSQIGIEFPVKKPSKVDVIEELRGKVKVSLEGLKGKKEWIEEVEIWKQMKIRFPEVIFIPASQDHTNEQKLTSESTVFGKIFRSTVKKWLKVDKESEAALDIISTKVEDINNKILEIVQTNLKEQAAFEDKLCQQIEPLDISKGFSFTMFMENAEGVQTELQNRGSGIQRSVLIAALRAQNQIQVVLEKMSKGNVDEKHLANQNVLYLFEEPEAFLHLSAQRELFYALKELTSKGNQIILTSHSTLFIDESDKEDIIVLIKGINGTISLQHIPEADIESELGENMKISEVITGKVCCLVEGISDKYAFQNWMQTLGYNYRQLGIYFIEMSGCKNIEWYANANILSDFKVDFLVVLDTDNHSKDNVAKIKTYLEQKHTFLKNKNRIKVLNGELENYFSLELVGDILKIPVDLINIENYKIDPKKELEFAKQKAIEQGLQARKYNENKHGNEISKKMTKEQIQGFDEIVLIIEELVELANK